MTNWMTAAGIALIAGGLATLIGFRHALWGGGGDRRRARPQRAIETPRRAALTAAPERPLRAAVPQQPRGSRRRRSAVPATDDAAPSPAAGTDGGRDRGRREPDGGRERGRREPDGGLASLGLADEEPGEELTDRPGMIDDSGDVAEIAHRPDAEQAADGEVVPAVGPTLDMSGSIGRARPASDLAPDVPTAGHGEAEVATRAIAGGAEFPARSAGGSLEFSARTAGDSAEFPARTRVSSAESPDAVEGPTAPAAPTARQGMPAAQRRIERQGDRVDDWVRPDYRSGAGSTGEYWTPVPENSYADGGYGWPVPVERLPEIPPYPPASGFDVRPVGESTAVVPEWPPAKPSERIEAPRSWPMKNDTRMPEAPVAGAATNVPDRNRVSRWTALDRQNPERSWRPVPPEPDVPAAVNEPAQPEAVPVRPDFAEQPAWSRLGPQRRRGPVTGYLPAVEESTQMLPSVDGLVSERGSAERPRSRPRPRPRPHQPENRSNVYVSKHAAEPG